MDLEPIDDPIYCGTNLNFFFDHKVDHPFMVIGWV